MTYSDYGIQIPANKHAGEVYTTCPNCSHTRKKSKDKCLGINLDKRVWRCNHCGWSGGIKEERIKIVYSKPEWKNKTELPDKVVKWFEGRGIRQATLERLKVTVGKEWMPQAKEDRNVIEFNYFRNNELINIKYRDAQKNFKMFKDAERIFYNIDSLKDSTEAVITEGEMDCLSFIEAGIDYTVSVPNGANDGNNNLEYLDNCIEYFVGKERIYIATDNDLAGRSLRYQLAERLGFERCVYIDYSGHKDANELLCKGGIEALHAAKNNYKEFPIEGVFTISDLEDDISDMYDMGLDKGVSTGIEDFNLNIVKGYITGVGGIPGHGKSDFIDNIIVHLRKNHGWKCAFYSPENKPTKLHIAKLARKIIGKHWDGANRISRDELKMLMDYLDGYVWFIKPEKDFSLDSILDSVRQLKLRHGIDCFVIDAWNKLEHRTTLNDHTYIGEAMDKLAVFCESVNVHCFLAVHPRKVQKDKDGLKYVVPTLYDMSGSSHFYNKLDNGITIYRDFEKEFTQVHRQKIKFDHWGTEGMSQYSYDIASKRYYVGYPDKSNWITGKTDIQEIADEIRSLRININSRPQQEEEDLF